MTPDPIAATSIDTSAVNNSAEVTTPVATEDDAGDALAVLTRQLEAATATGDPDEWNRVVRQMDAANAAKRPAVPALPRKTQELRTTPQSQGAARHKPRPALPESDKDKWPANWGNQYRGVPNELIRNALFNIRHNEPRQRLDNAPIASLRNQVMLYSGEELRIRDEDVLAQIFHFQRDFKLGERWVVSAMDFLSALGRSTGMRAYKELYEILIRLSKAHITILRKDGADEKVILEAGSLLTLRIEHTSRGGPTNITVSVNPDTRQLWETLGYTLVDWDQRQGLRSPLAKYLHRFYSSHEAPFPYRVVKLRELTGSSVESLNKFRQLLRSALEALVEIGFLDGYYVDSGDLVHVVKTQPLTLQK
jgi:hypothetical protein